MNSVFVKISGAYNTLKRPWTRKKYNEMREQSEEKVFSTKEEKPEQTLTEQYQNYLQRFASVFNTDDKKPFKEKLNIIGESNLYHVLGVEKSISHEELKAHFKKLEKRYNPINYSFVLLTGQEVREMNLVYSKMISAFKILKNKELRENYDNSIKKGI